MATGYEDIDRLTEQQGTMLDESLKQQQDIVNKQTQMNIDALERNKAEIDESYSAFASKYKGYERVLGNSGYAETTQTNLYNTYQKNVTDTINNAQKLKSDFDFKINEAMQTGNLTIAQNALEIYKQKMQLLTQEYELRNNREQYLYSKEQDALQQSNWEKEYAYQQERDQVSDQQWQQSIDYQKQRDAIADQQWAKEYALSSRKASGGNELKVIDDDDGGDDTTPLSQNVQILIDGLTKSGVANTSDKALKEKARQLIYADQQWGRITDSEAGYLFKQLNLEEE